MTAERKAQQIEAADAALVMHCQLMVEAKGILDRLELLDDLKERIADLEIAVSQ